jgi:hypothetical protein
VKFRISRIAATGAVVGLLAVGGAGYAYAQSSDSSPSTTTPGNGSSTDNGGGHDPANCPHMGGDHGATSSSYSRGV